MQTGSSAPRLPDSQTYDLWGSGGREQDGKSRDHATFLGFAQFPFAPRPVSSGCMLAKPWVRERDSQAGPISWANVTLTVQGICCLQDPGSLPVGHDIDRAPIDRLEGGYQVPASHSGLVTVLEGVSGLNT